MTVSRHEAVTNNAEQQVSTVSSYDIRGVERLRRELDGLIREIKLNPATLLLDRRGYRVTGLQRKTATKS